MSIAICLVAVNVYADGLGEKYKGSGSEKKEELDKAHKTLLDLELGVSSLNDIKRTLGDAVVHVSEDIHEPDTLCYSSQKEHDDTIVIVESGPSCGPSREFVGFIIASEGAIDPEYIGECKPSSLVDRNASTESGIKLGISPDQLIGMLGPPTSVDGNTFSYSYEVQKRMSDEEIEKVSAEFKTPDPYPYFDLSAWIEAEFSSEKLIRFSVYEVDSY